MLGIIAVISLATKYIEHGLRSQKEKIEQSAEESDRAMRLQYREYNDSANLVIMDTKERITGDEFTVLGSIQNHGQFSWSNVKLMADLYDEGGTFMEQCGAYIMQTLTPTKVANFKLSCESRPNFKLDKYHSYKLSIVDAHFIRTEYFTEAE